MTGKFTTDILSGRTLYIEEQIFINQEDIKNMFLSANTYLGFVTTGTTQTISGQKTFTSPVYMLNGLYVSGTTTYINTENLNISDNFILINSGETGAGVTKGIAGIEVDRGTEPKYGFYFEESTDTFRIGTTGETQAVATREDDPYNNSITYWNNNDNRLNTISGFTYDSNGVNIVGNLNITGITNVNGSVLAAVDSGMVNKGIPYWNSGLTLFQNSTGLTFDNGLLTIVGDNSEVAIRSGVINNTLINRGSALMQGQLIVGSEYNTGGIDTIFRVRNPLRFESVLVYDGVSYIDRTLEARTGIPTSTFTPLYTGSTTGYLYLGGLSKFDTINFPEGSLGSGYTLQFEYWDGDSWEIFTPYDGTQNLTISEWNTVLDNNPIITWSGTTLTDWSMTTVDSKNYYWVRISTTTNAITAYNANLIIPGNYLPFVFYANYGDSGYRFNLDYKGFPEATNLFRIKGSDWNVLEFYNTGPILKIKNSNITSQVFQFQFDNTAGINRTNYRLGYSDAIFNYQYNPVNFTIRKNTSGTAYQYDATLDTHTFNSNINIIGNINVSGNTILNGDLTITGDTTFNINYKYTNNTQVFVTTSTYNIPPYVAFVGASAITAAISMLLPSAVTFGVGKIMIKDTILNANTRNTTINASGTDLIINVGTTPVSNITISTRGGSYTLWSDGINRWYVV